MPSSPPSVCLPARTQEHTWAWFRIHKRNFCDTTKPPALTKKFLCCKLICQLVKKQIDLLMLLYNLAQTVYYEVIEEILQLLQNNSCFSRSITIYTPEGRSSTRVNNEPGGRTVSSAIAITTIKCFGLMVGLQVARSGGQGLPSYR